MGRKRQDSLFANIFSSDFPRCLLFVVPSYGGLMEPRSLTSRWLHGGAEEARSCRGVPSQPGARVKGVHPRSEMRD